MKVSKETRELANQIFEHVMAWCDHGQFMGKGRERQFVFTANIIDKKTMKTTSIPERITDDIAIMIANALKEDA